MKVLDSIARAKSVKDFFDHYYRTKFLIVETSRLKELNLIRLMSDLSDRDLYDAEFAAYIADEGFETFDFGSNINQIFQNSIGVIAIQDDLDDITLFETKEDLDDYVDSYQYSLQDSIALEITSEMIDDFLEQDRLKRIKSLKEDIRDYQKSIDRMTKELEKLEKIAEM